MQEATCVEPLMFRAAEVLRALSHPVRLKVALTLMEGESCVCRLLPRLGVSQPNLSQHLAVMRSAGVLRSRREGNVVLCSLCDDPLVRSILEALAGSMEEVR